jgi:pimeloyl-ACP methyl ester carboxylesterase
VIEALVRQFLYHPTALPRHAPLPAYASDAREVFIATQGEHEIHGLYWPPEPGRPTILFFHGNAQTVFEWALVREDLADLECGMLLVDYPGYGKSTGAPSEQALYRAGRAAQRWLADACGTAPGETVIFGKSLGGGVATDLALTARFRGLVLESTFSSLPDAAEHIFPWLPSSMLVPTERYESIERMPLIDTPVIIVHGTDDALIPIEQARALYARANQPKELYCVDGAGHNDVALTVGPAYGRRLRQWLEQT